MKWFYFIINFLTAIDLNAQIIRPPTLFNIENHALERMRQRFVSEDLVREIVQSASTDVHINDENNVPVQYGVLNRFGFFINSGNRNAIARLNYTPRLYQGIMMSTFNQPLSEFFNGVTWGAVMISLAVYEDERNDRAPVNIRTVFIDYVTMSMVGINRLAILRTNEETFDKPKPFFIMPVDKRNL